MNEDELTQEDIDEYNKRRQEEYDEATKGNEEIRRKQEGDQQLELPLESRKLNPARVGAGLAFEVGANTLLDALTAIPGSQQLGSAAINAIAQGIRGGKFSFGEVLASAAASQIPGLSQAKAITKAGRLARATGQGAVSGAIEATSIAAVDEGRLPTAQEFGLGVGAGGIFGAGFNLAGDKLVDPKVTGMFRDLKARINNPQSSFELAGTVGAAKVNPAGKGNRIDLADLTLRTAKLDPANPYYARIKRAASKIPKYIEENEGGALVFNYNLFQNSIKGSGEDGRQFLELFQTEMSRIFEGVPTEVGAQGFRNFDIATMQRTFKPAAELLGLTGRGTVGRMDASNTHHIAALKGIMGIYDNLGFGSPMYKQVNDVFAKYTKGLGGQEGNFVRLIGGTSDVGSPHYLAHAFLNDAIGRDGRKFFTDDVLANMNASDSVRLQKADELARIVADSAAVAEQAQNVYRTVAEAANAEDYAEIMKTTARLLDKGLLKMAQIRGTTYSPRVSANIAGGKYVTRNFDNLIEDIALIHKALPSAKPADIDKILFSEQLLKSQKSFQKLVRKIEEKFGDKGVTAQEMRKILDSFDVRMQNQGVGQTGLFEDMPDNLLDDVLNRLALKKQKARAKLNQKKYKKDPDIN